jgi:hypothetical protein
MSTEPAPATNAPVPPLPAEKPHPAADQPFAIRIQRSWKVAAVAAILMVMLGLLGIALTTTTDYAVASTYWIALVPVYGLLCIATAWRHQGRHMECREVFRQFIHWSAIGLALGVDFYIRGSGVETGLAAGLNAMLLLALGCVLAGIHLDWLFVVVGLLLGVALVVVAKADQYLWMMFIAGGIAIVAMVAYVWLLGPKHPKKTAAVS